MPTDALRSELIAELSERDAHFAQAAVAFVETLTDDTPAFDRANAALHMYRERAAVEQIEQTLDKFPQARFCDACPPPEVNTTGRRAAPRLGSDRGERAHTTPSARSPL